MVLLRSPRLKREAHSGALLVGQMVLPSATTATARSTTMLVLVVVHRRVVGGREGLQIGPSQLGAAREEHFVLLLLILLLMVIVGVQLLVQVVGSAVAAFGPASDGAARDTTTPSPPYASTLLRLAVDGCRCGHLQVI